MSLEFIQLMANVNVQMTDIGAYATQLIFDFG